MKQTNSLDIKTTAKQYSALISFISTLPLDALPTPHKDIILMPPSQATKIAILETRLESVAGSVGQINNRLDTLQDSLDEKTLPINSLTGKLIARLSVGLLTLAGVILGGFSWYHASRLAATEDKETKFESSVNSQLAATKTDLSGQIGQLKSDINTQLTSLHNELDGFIKQLIRTPEDVVKTTQRAISAPRTSLGQTLPIARRVLAAAKEKSIVLAASQIKTIAQPLLTAKPTDPSLAQEQQLTLTALASYKTFSDFKSQPLPKEVIDTAKSTDKYFENREIYLGQRELWSDVVFKDCEIVTGEGTAKLALQNVSFVNCTFRQTQKNDLAGQRLNEAIIRSTSSTISVVLYNFPMERNKTGS